MTVYGTKPLDDAEFPKELVVSSRVKAHRLHLDYVIRTPYDNDVRRLMTDSGLVYSGGAGGWLISHRNLDRVKRVMSEAESILAGKLGPCPQSDVAPAPGDDDASPSP